jgi:hypothetical protein
MDARPNPAGSADAGRLPNDADRSLSSCELPSSRLFDLRTEPLAPTPMPTQHHHVTQVSLPPESRIANAYASTNLVDAFSIELPSGASSNPEQLARFIFSHQDPWIGSLLALRDAIVGGFGLKTAKQLTALGAEGKTSRVSIFKIYGTSPTEIVLGEDDKHLDFRLSVLCSSEPSPGGKRQLTLSTVVHCHNRLGRLYIFIIAPFHRLVVQSSLRSAARIGWPMTTEA